MRIVETNIPDIQRKNIPKSKIKLADEIISRISPLFDEVHASKSTKIEELKRDLQRARKQVLEDKQRLESLKERYNRQKHVKVLLNKVSKLVSSGLVHEGNLKAETIVMLKIIDKLSVEKLKHYDAQMTNLINKRFRNA